MGVGRKRKSAAEHQANGNPSRREIRQEPKFKPGKGEMPPDWLDDGAKNLWHEMMPMLERTKVFTEADRYSFAMYCLHCSAVRRATLKLQECGDIYVNTNGNVQPSPYDTILRQHSALMHKYGGEFGLTPATRSKVALAGGGEKKSAEEAEMFGD